jgi:cysteine desulfurase
MKQQKLIYLDHAAATPIDPLVLRAMQPFFSQQFYNPSATYAAARQVRQALESARQTVAHWLGAKTSEIIFTAGGTEANNLAIHGIMVRYPKANIVISAIEHESVRTPAEHYEYREVPVHADGRIDEEALLKSIDAQTVLVSVMYANNEIGTIQPIREISRRLDEVKKARRQAGNDLPIYLHTDACQAANYLDLHVSRLGVDLMTINGGKIYGPKQSGALFIKTGAVLEPLIYGGGQERNLRSGTENVASCVGLATALEIAQSNRHEETERLQKVQLEVYQSIEKYLPRAVVNGSQKFRLPNNLHLTLPGSDNERLIFELDERGILVAAGSACNASSEEPSHVLAAIGLDDGAARSSLRITLGRETASDDIRRAIQVLAELTSAK